MSTINHCPLSALPVPAINPNIPLERAMKRQRVQGVTAPQAEPTEMNGEYLGARIFYSRVFPAFLFWAFLRARELWCAVEAARPAGKIEPTGIRWDTERSISQHTV